VLDRLSSLVDKNLVRHHATLEDEARFSMLETIRAFAAERRTEAMEDEMLAARHASWFAAAAEADEPHVRSRDNSSASHS